MRAFFRDELPRWKMRFPPDTCTLYVLGVVFLRDES